ncbi:MAG: hypothetical protein AAFR41_01825 [Pseudomonadota bacterium]
MRQGMRTNRRWIAGLAAVAGLVAIAALDISQNGMELQAGPIMVSMDMQRDDGIAIRFERLARHTVKRGLAEKAAPRTGMAS